VTVPRPRIGLAAYWTEARWTYWDLPVALVPAGYVEGVRLAGGLPLVLPPTPEGAAEPGEVLDALDGLLLIGGPDLGVDLYGSPEQHPETSPKQERRDAFELALLLEARRRAQPVLGICRGMQLLDVAAGGDLVQHLADAIDPAPHRPGPGIFGRHGVALEPGTLAASILGETVDVHSAHHQGVGRVGEGLVVSARAPDGQIEAVEDPALPFCLGVLWHPEEDPEGAGAPLFRALVEAARAYAGARHGAAG
jgi:gamma-glutamyl-gamma-aminobutyrate hydrolase PuuD